MEEKTPKIKKNFDKKEPFRALFCCIFMVNHGFFIGKLGAKRSKKIALVTALR